MIELSRIEDAVLQNIGMKISNIMKDEECKEYYGYNFQIEKLKIKFRKAKITPKKSGQFVTLWRRNTQKQTEPYSLHDDIDFYIIATEQKDRFGFFFFPKRVLGEKYILTHNNRVGKRGFRIYPDWDIPTNRQAEKAKIWQAAYFIDLTKNGDKNIKKFHSLIQHK